MFKEGSDLKWRKEATAIGDYFSVVFKWLAMGSGVVILVMMFYIVGDVIGRYFFGKPLLGTFEISVTLLVFIAFLSLPYTQAIGRHLRLESVFHRLNPRGQSILDVFSLLIGLVTFSLITWQAWNWTYLALQTNETMEGSMGLPYFPSRLAFTVGSFLLWCQYVFDLFRRINQLLKKE